MDGERGKKIHHKVNLGLIYKPETDEEIPTLMKTNDIAPRAPADACPTGRTHSLFYYVKATLDDGNRIEVYKGLQFYSCTSSFRFKRSRSSGAVEEKKNKTKEMRREKRDFVMTASKARSCDY